MKKYPAAPKSNDRELKKSPATGLEFPVAPDFHSCPPRVDPQVMLRRIEENLAWRSTRPGEKERRAVQGVTKEFVL